MIYTNVIINNRRIIFGGGTYVRIDSASTNNSIYSNAKKMFQEQLPVTDEQFDKFYETYQQEPLQKKQIADFFKQNNVNPMRQIVLDYKKEEILKGNDFSAAFSVTQDRTSRGDTNAVSLIPNTKIDLGNGTYLQITSNGVTANMQNNNSYDENKIKEANKMAGSLKSFIQYANGQSGSLYFDKDAQSSVASVLSKMGIDTSKDFLVNGEKFTCKDGSMVKANESAGYSLVSNNITKQVLQRTIDKYTSTFSYA